MTIREWAKVLGLGLLVEAGITWLYFCDITWFWAGLFSSGVAVKTFISQIRYRKALENKQAVKDALRALCAALSSGFSVEHAIWQAKRELIRTWGEKSRIVQEMEQMEKNLSCRIPLSEVMKQWACRMGSRELTDMAGLFVTAQSGSGRVKELFEVTAVHLEEKLLVESERHLLMTENRTEFYLMMLVPAGMMLFLKNSYPELVASLYGSRRWIMLSFLAVYSLAWVMGCRVIYEEEAADMGKAVPRGTGAVRAHFRSGKTGAGVSAAEKEAEHDPDRNPPALFGNGSRR